MIRKFFLCLLASTLWAAPALTCDFKITAPTAGATVSSPVSMSIAQTSVPLPGSWLDFYLDGAYKTATGWSTSETVNLGTASTGSHTLSALECNPSSTGSCTQNCKPSVTVTVGSSGPQPIRANDFLNTLGTTSHFVQGRDTGTQLQNALLYLGTRIDREDFPYSSSILSAMCSIHTATGVKYDPLPADGAILTTEQGWEPLAACGALRYVEGPNEPNNFPFSYNGAACNINSSFLPCAQFQRDLYASVRADTKLNGIPMLTFTEVGAEPDNTGAQWGTSIPSGATGTELPVGTKFSDTPQNLHNYVKGNGEWGQFVHPNQAWFAESPAAAVSATDGPQGEFCDSTWYKHFPANSLTTCPSLARVTTETGWDTPSISEDQQGKLLTNLYLSAAKRGWAATMIYQLLNDSGDSFGLFLNDSGPTPKKSATYIHNLTTILADTSSAFTVTIPAGTPGVAGETTTIHDLLMQKSPSASQFPNAYYWAVWNDQPVGSSASTVTVNLGGTYSTVNVYDPTVGTSPVQTKNSVSSVTLSLSDHAQIVEF